MMRALFRSYPARSQLDYAEALQKEGLFDETTRNAWSLAYRDWVEGFGKMVFQEDDFEIYLEADAKDVDQIADTSKVDRPLVERAIDIHQKVSNYKFWRTKAHAEMQVNTQGVHRELYEAEQLFKKGDLEASQEALDSGLKRYELMLETYPDLGMDDNTLEEGLWAVMLWQKIYQLKNQIQPEEFPLKAIWEREAGRIPNIQQDFNRKFGPSS